MRRAEPCDAGAERRLHKLVRLAGNVGAQRVAAAMEQLRFEEVRGRLRGWYPGQGAGAGSAL